MSWEGSRRGGAGGSVKDEVLNCYDTLLHELLATYLLTNGVGKSVYENTYGYYARLKLEKKRFEHAAVGHLCLYKYVCMYNTSSELTN